MSVVSAMDVHPVAAAIAGVTPFTGRIVTSPRPPAHTISTVSVRPRTPPQAPPDSARINDEAYIYLAASEKQQRDIYRAVPEKLGSIYVSASENKMPVDMGV